MVKIGHAHISERGTIDGIKGDQTKGEVCITNWISNKWIAVYRPKDARQAAIIASKCEDACNNDNIGYSQYSRLSLFNLVCNNGYDIKNLKTPCNCDCSSLVMVCCRAANITVPKSMFTYSMDADLMKTGNFEKLTDSKYLTTYNHLKRGDILLMKGHTAIVVTGGTQAYEKPTIKAKRGADKFDARISGTKITTGNVYMRSGAGKEFDTLCVIKKNMRVINYGYYSNSSDGTMWLYCVYESNVTRYIGFVSARYLK